MRLRERVHLGIALHAAVNVGFGLAATMTVVAPAAASVSLAPAAPDPSPPPTLAVVFTLGERPLVSVLAVRSSRTRAARSALVEGLDRFDRLAMCESGGDPGAVSPSGQYRGAFQFSLPTWRSAGGSGDPIETSYDVQKRIAEAWADVVNPATQWPVCWPRTS